MRKVFVILGALLAASGALVFFGGRGAQRREKQAHVDRISAAEAAAKLRAAWADHHTQA